MGKIKNKIGKYSFVETSAGTFALGSSLSNDMSWFFNGNSNNWDIDPVSIAGVRIVPWGSSNNMPVAIRDILEKNNLGPGILDRKTGLLYGQGPMLYRYKLEGNERSQEWMEDQDIQDWLDSWDYKKFIRDSFIEYTHLKGVFVKYFSGKAIRIGKPWVAKLECLSSKDCRLVYPEDNIPSLDNVKQILTGDFDENKWFKLYNVFDKWNPTSTETAVKYHSIRSFGRNLYSMSSFFGSVPWLENANNIPEIIRYLNENMIAAAYIVHEPNAYWQEKREMIEDTYPDLTDEQVQKKISDLRDQVTETIANVMAGKRNAGKFFTCVDFVDDTGKTQEWKIEPIEMNIDKYIEAQSKISKIADSSTTSGFGLSPALANIIIDGKSDSGSQMLYALKIFYGADTQIPEDIALEAINDAIRINFPNKKGIFLGIYRKAINKEDNISAEDRTTNNM